MKIIEASYGASYELLGLWEKISLRAEISEGDDEQEALALLKKQVQQFHERSNPIASPGEKVIQIEKKPKLTPKDVLIGEINACTSVTMLEQNKLLATNYGLMDEYNQKLKQFK